MSAPPADVAGAPLPAGPVEALTHQRPVEALTQRPVEALTQRPVEALTQRPVEVFPQRPVGALTQRPVGALPQRPDTPCVAVCSTTFDDICRGCGRTVVEVAHWVSMTAEQKETVWQRILAQGYPRRNT